MLEFGLSIIGHPRYVADELPFEEEKLCQNLDHPSRKITCIPAVQWRMIFSTEIRTSSSGLKVLLGPLSLEVAL